MTDKHETITLAELRKTELYHNVRKQVTKPSYQEVSSKPVGRYYWESVADYQFMAVPSEGTIHYEVDDFPLYTHPHKQLSDEEILQIIKKSDFPLAELSESAVRGMTNFARAIIKEITE